VRPTSTSILGIELRRFRPTDDEFVALLADEAFREYDARPGRYLLRATHRATTMTWIAVEKGAPIGMLVLDRSAGEWSILAVAVAARARARGVGGLLLQTAEESARRLGASQLSLFTADANLAALDLFLRRGFRIVARRRGFYSRHQDACRLVKRLSGAGPKT
jgi:[ribosomal protein S18]-alanine N-acetyltransferase